MNRRNNPQIEAEITGKTYKKIFEDYIKTNKEIHSEMIQMLDHFVSLLPGRKVLDVGCAHGRESKYLCEKGLDVTGCDLSEKFIETAKTNCPGCQFYVCDMRKLPMDVMYDGLWVCSSFLHIPKVEGESTLTNFSKILGKKGILYLSVMEGNFDGLRQNGTMNWPERHFSDYTKEELQKLLEKVGFSVEKLEIIKVDWGPTFLHFFCTKR
jgi:cyclopropane fatty-acyl-phospholipid synthase-like methyltransferase